MNREELKPHLDKFGPYLRVKLGLSARSRDLYLRILQRILLALGTATPTQDEIYRYLGEVYEETYSRSHLRNIQISIEYYMGYLGTPLEFKRPKKKGGMVGDVLSEAEVAVLIAASGNIREKAMISLLACSGLRNQELCDLRVKDLDLSQNLVRVLDGKGGSVGYCGVPSECVAILAQYIQHYHRGPDDYLFATLRGGRQYSTTALRRLIKKLASRAKLNKHVHPHLLRHTLASNLLKRGATIFAVQQQLRHRHLATTMIYLHSGHGGDYRREIAYFQPAYL